jgi:signal peptidase I
MFGSIALFGQQILLEGAAPTSNAAVILGLALLILTIWGFVIALRTVGAVQDFGLIRSFASVLIPLVALLAAALLIRFFLFQPFSIPAGSMQPALLIGDYFFANKLSYGYSRYSCPFCPEFAGRVFPAEPDRGDIVVFKLPRDNTTDYVKRVIGLPGDEISVRDGVLYINGTEVPRRRIENFTMQQDGGPAQEVPAFEETLPNGVKYTVIETDANGPFDNVGPYKVPEGHYFVMGDNRDNSTDSRASWGVGYVPFDNLIGRASLIYLSVNPLDGSEGPSNALDNIRWDRLLRVPR